MQAREVDLVEIDPCHVHLIGSSTRWQSWLLAEDGPRDLLSHKAINIPIVVCQVTGILEVVEDLLAERTKFAC